MKKALSLLLALILCLSLCACGNQDKYKKYDALIDYIEAGDTEKCRQRGPFSDRAEWPGGNGSSRSGNHHRGDHHGQLAGVF